MKKWEKPNMWELSAKCTATGVPIVTKCNKSGGGSNSGGGSSSGGGDDDKNKDIGKTKGSKKKKFDMISWFTGQY